MLLFISIHCRNDTISSELFTLVLEDVFKTLNWEDNATCINRKYLNNIRSADGLNINFSQTKVM